MGGDRRPERDGGGDGVIGVARWDRSGTLGAKGRAQLGETALAVAGDAEASEASREAALQVAAGFGLRSTTGRAEGPYEYVSRAASQASAFVDDGQAYFFSNGRLTEWDPRGNNLEGRRIDLQTTMGTRFAKGDVATNPAKIHGKYVVFATGWCGGTYGENYRVDGTYDWVYWQSDKLAGPYDLPRLRDAALRPFVSTATRAGWALVRTVVRQRLDRLPVVQARRVGV